MKAKRKRARREPLLKRWRFTAQAGSKRISIRSDGGCELTEGESVVTIFPPMKFPPFDEVVVGGMPCAVHVEAMDTNSLFVGLGLDVKLSVWRDRKGKIRVRLYEGELDPATGEIHEHGWAAKGKRAGTPKRHHYRATKTRGAS